MAHRPDRRACDVECVGNPGDGLFASGCSLTLSINGESLEVESNFQWVRLEVSWLHMVSTERAVLAVGLFLSRASSISTSFYLHQHLLLHGYFLSRKGGSMSSFLNFESKYQFAVLASPEYGAYYPPREGFVQASYHCI
jgi:hypothetical protein